MRETWQGSHWAPAKRQWPGKRRCALLLLTEHNARTHKTILLALGSAVASGTASKPSELRASVLAQRRHQPPACCSTTRRSRPSSCRGVWTPIASAENIKICSCHFTLQGVAEQWQELVAEASPLYADRKHRDRQGRGQEKDTSKDVLLVMIPSS